MPTPVRIEIGPRKAVTITVPTIRRSDLQSVIVDFFARGNEVSKRDLERAFSQGGDLTLVMTTTR